MERKSPRSNPLRRKIRRIRKRKNRRRPTKERRKLKSLPVA